MTTNHPVPEVSPARGGPSKGTIVVGVLVGLVVVLGVALVLSNLPGGSGEQPASGTSSTSVTSSPAATDPSSFCGLKDVAMDGTVAAAPSAIWSLLGTMAVPAIEGQGPGKVEEDGYRSCFARTPTGALLAAANYSMMGSYGPLQAKFYTNGVAPGPGRDAMVRSLETAVEGGTGGVQIAGFRVLRYDGNNADVEMAIKVDTGVMVAMVLNLRWVERDWKFMLADDGSALSPVVQIRTLEGYVPWSGE